MCCLPGPESNLLHCRVSVVKTVKALLDMLTLFETIVKECDFESLWVYRRQAVPINSACNISPYNGIIWLHRESYYRSRRYKHTHKHIQEHVGSIHSPIAATLASKLLAFVFHLITFIYMDIYWTCQVHSSALPYAFTWLADKEEKKEVLLPFLVIGNKRRSLEKLWDIFSMASTSSLAHSSLTGPESPLS